jgi:carboxymethylenebutenolidase
MPSVSIASMPIRAIDPRVIELYDEYTHAPLPRRVFMRRLVAIAGSVAAATAILPLIENNYAQAALFDPADKRIVVETMAFAGGTGDVSAYLATPKVSKKKAKRAGVIVIHENRGLNAHIQDVARRVSIAGYTALAPDMLSPLGGTPANEDEARAGFGKLDKALTVQSLVAAVAYLKQRTDSNGKVGVVGFCWGGGMANLLAANAPDLAAAVPFYGMAPSVEDAGKIKCKLMMHYAGKDDRINGSLAGYEAALKAAGVGYEKFVYEGVEHAFANDTAGARYNEVAAKLAWSRTLAFFKRNLG